MAKVGRFERGRLTLVPSVFSGCVRRFPLKASTPSTASPSTSASRRCSSTRRSAASPSRPTARSTCACRKAGESAADFLNHADEARSPTYLPPYGEEPSPGASPARSSRAADRDDRAARRVVRKAVGHKPGRRRTRRPGPSRRSGSTSTRSFKELEGGLAAAEQVLARRPPSRGHVPQPRGPHREALPQGAQRRAAVALAAPAGGQRDGPAPTFEAVARPVRPARPSSPPTRARAPPPCAPPAAPRRRRGTRQRHRRRDREDCPSDSWSAPSRSRPRCYMLSLQVAASAPSCQVEQPHRLAQREIRSLQTELSTRGRSPAQAVERQEVLPLSAPSAGQFLESDVSLARFDPWPSPRRDRGPPRPRSTPPARRTNDDTPARRRRDDRRPAPLEVRLGRGAPDPPSARPPKASRSPSRRICAAATAPVRRRCGAARASPARRCDPPRPARPGPFRRGRKALAPTDERSDTLS